MKNNSKKWIVLLLGLSLALLALAGCRKKNNAAAETTAPASVAETAAETAAAETEAEKLQETAAETTAETAAETTEAAAETEAETEPETEEEVPQDEVLSNTLFSFIMPAEYAGTYEVEYGDEFNSINVYDKAAKEEFGGYAFGIYAFEKPGDHAWMPNGMKAGELVDKDGVVYDIMLEHPSDVQWDPVNDTSGTYMALYDLGEELVKTLEGVDGSVYYSEAGMHGEDLYPVVLGQLSAAISEGWNAGKLEKAGMSPMYYAMSMYEDGDLLDRIGFAYHDINLDGVDELLIGEVAEDEQDSVIYDIYTMADREPAHVVSGTARNRYYITGDREVCNEYSNNMGESFWYIYGVLPNEGGLYSQMAFKLDESGKHPGYYISYDPEDENAWEEVTRKDWIERKQTFESYNRFDFTPLTNAETEAVQSIAEEGGRLPDAPVTVEAVFLGDDKQPLNNGEEMQMLDTVWIYLSDGTFRQYAMMNGKMQLFSTGYYAFGEGGSFLPPEDPEKPGSIIIERHQKYDPEEGLIDSFSSHEYKLGSLGFFAASSPEKEKEEVQILFGAKNQSYKDIDGVESQLDTIWIYYSDNSFEQYAFMEDGPVLFGTGTYELGYKGGMIANPDPEAGATIRVNYTALYDAENGLAENESSHVYRLGAMGMDALYTFEALPRYLKKDVSVLATYAAPEAQIFTTLTGEKTKLNSFWMFYSDDSYEQYAKLENGYEVFSSGTYAVEKDGSYVLHRTEKYNAQGGLTEGVADLGFDPVRQGYAWISLEEAEEKEVFSVFAESGRQEFTDENGISRMLDTIWVYYADGSFNQYVFQKDNILPFSSGNYAFTADGDFCLNGENAEKSYVKLTYDQEAGPDMEMTDSESTKVLDLDAFGYTPVYQLLDENLLMTLHEEEALTEETEEALEEGAETEETEEAVEEGAETEETEEALEEGAETEETEEALEEGAETEETEEAVEEGAETEETEEALEEGAETEETEEALEAEAEGEESQEAAESLKKTKAEETLEEAEKVEAAAEEETEEEKAEAAEKAETEEKAEKAAAADVSGQAETEEALEAEAPEEKPEEAVTAETADEAEDAAEEAVEEAEDADKEEAAAETADEVQEEPAEDAEAVEEVKKEAIEALKPENKTAPVSLKSMMNSAPKAAAAAVEDAAEKYPFLVIPEESEIYTEDDIHAAVDVIMEEFNTWKGCEMHEIRYAGDEANSEENLEWLNNISIHRKGRGDYTQCVEFLSDFHSPIEAYGSWEADTEYEDYQWWLARVEDGDWDLLSWGY